MGNIRMGPPLELVLFLAKECKITQFIETVIKGVLEKQKGVRLILWSYKKKLKQRFLGKQ